MTPDLFFSMLDFGWVARQITDGNPIPFLLWTAFIAALGFVAGRWWRCHDDERQIDRRLGKIDEFSRVRTLSDLMEKADELAQSASAEIMVERTRRITELETQVARQALEIDERRAENAKLKEIIESTGIDELENLRRENADLKNELTIVRSSAWYEKHKEGMASKQARGRFSMILPKEAEIIRSLYNEGTMSMLKIEPRTLHSMKDKGIIMEGDPSYSFQYPASTGEPSSSSSEAYAVNADPNGSSRTITRSPRAPSSTSTASMRRLSPRSSEYTTSPTANGSPVLESITFAFI